MLGAVAGVSTASHPPISRPQKCPQKGLFQRQLENGPQHPVGPTQPESELRREFHGGEKDVGVLPSGVVGGGLLQGRVWRDGRRLEGQRGPPEQPDSWCLWSRDMREKVREHVLHWYFLTSECVWRCARRLERSAKARLQWGQEKGFSPGERESRESVRTLSHSGQQLSFTEVST